MYAHLLDKVQRQSWQDKGYLVVRRAADPDLVQHLVGTLWGILDMSPQRPADWYDMNIRARSAIDERGIIPAYHDAPFWESRQIPAIYDAFRAIYGDDDLYLFVDRCNMNPPQRPDWTYEGFLHWDIDVTRRPIGILAQGLLALTDTDVGDGGFQCVPGFHRIIEEWLDKQEAGYATRFPDVSGMPVESVALHAGDMLIWHGALPHGNTGNKSDKPRLAQYITMRPAQEISEDVFIRNRKALFEGSGPIAPGGTHLPKDPRGIPLDASVLTPLGRKLLKMEAINR